MRWSYGILIAKKPAMHSQRSRIESAGRRAIAGDGCHYAGARVHGGESHLEHLSANPNGQQQKHKAGGVKVGEHDQPRSGTFFGLRMSTQNQTATMKLHAEKNAAMYCM